MNGRLKMVPGGALVLSIALFAALDTYAKNDTFTNPVAPVGHDPWVIRHDGVYFYCYSEQNKLWVNRSADLTRAVQFEGKAVWTPPRGKPYSNQLWAPELHFLDRAWFIYVAASNGQNENHRMYVLRSETPDGLFEMMGKMVTPEDKWAIDGTVLETGGRRYFIWSGWEGDVNDAQHLYIAEMDSPTSLRGERVKISSPEYDWERRRGNGPRSDTMPYINEGPEVLQHAGDT
ncbi:MAG: glycoside hydrolase family 43 protein, partial [Verrucomicrobiae bacterium]|nr:glycoside hydrolase family 43 protein [Verrucomicrobiae bacterium]